MSTSKRLKEILDTNSQEISASKYMTDFPALKKPTGYRLVCLLYQNKKILICRKLIVE